MRNLMFFSKVPNDFRQARRLNVFIRREMIRYETDFIFIKDRFANAVKFFNRWRCCNIVGQHAVQLTRN